MKPPILDRAFQHPPDGWYHLEPVGEHPNAAAKIIQVIDAAACAAIVHRFNAGAAAGALRHGHELLIDHEHFRHQRDQESVAYGWLNQLQARADGIYGRIRWTATGQKAVDGGEYRFFSTEYAPADLEALDARRVRPLRLDGLTLTNDPNNRGARPITNRQDTFAASTEAADPQTTKITSMKKIAEKLGLAAEASEDAILAALTTIQNRVAELTPFAEENQTLLHRVQALDTASVDSLLAAHGVTEARVLNRIKPVLLGLPVADRQLFLDECLAKPAATAAPAAQVKLHNRDTKPPHGNPALDAAGPGWAAARKIMNRAQEIQRATPNVTDATAVLMAQREMTDHGDATNATNAS